MTGTQNDNGAFSTSARGGAWRDCAAAIASRLAPTGIGAGHQLCEHPKQNCGSLLAIAVGQIALRVDAASAAMAARTLGRAAIRAMNAASAGQSLIWILNNGSQFKTVNK